VGVAEPAVTAAQQHGALPGLGKVGQHSFLVLVEHLGSDRHAQHHVLTGSTGPVLAHAVAAARGLEVLLVAIVDQGIEPIDHLDDDIAAPAAVATVRPAELDELLAPEGDDAGSAVTALEVYLGLIEEFHGPVSTVWG